MTVSDQPYTVESFDRIEARDGAVLLRVSVATPDASISEAPPELLVDTRGGRTRFTCVAAQDRPGRRRLAYSVDAKLLEHGPLAFALELADGTLVELPSPSLKRRRRPGADAASPPPLILQGAATPAAPDPAGELQYSWMLRERMAERGMYLTTTLAPLLAERGVVLSSAQIYRLVAGTPERLNLNVLAALCSIFDCSPNDLIKCRPTPT